ncbi:MAG: hypothetical protein FJ294_06480 [Planctomycetes bacterium]|nr:hypothetical protein [Planctomycetota bacterium]
MPAPQALFPTFLLLTVALLGLVVYTGLKAKLRLHLALVVLTLLSLALAIVAALALGKLYDLESAGWITPVHLNLARIATYAYALPAATGVMTLRNRQHRKLHFRMAMFTLTLTVLAAVTGAWMIFHATPLAAQS